MKKLFFCILSFGIILSANISYAETTIERLVRGIVRPSDSNDIKMDKVQKWIIKNIQYRSDSKQFNMTERWTLPPETLQRRKGDCEDGSILMIAFATTAGIPSHRLRMYAPIRLPEGYHACVAYQREIDNQWVWAEWTCKSFNCFKPVIKRETMAENQSYVTMGTYLKVTSLNPFRMTWEED